MVTRRVRLQLIAREGIKRACDTHVAAVAWLRVTSPCLAQRNVARDRVGSTLSAAAATVRAWRAAKLTFTALAGEGAAHVVSENWEPGVGEFGALAKDFCPTVLPHRLLGVALTSLRANFYIRSMPETALL